jgi:hypothetical protein
MAGIHFYMIKFIPAIPHCLSLKVCDLGKGAAEEMSYQDDETCA